MGDDLKTQWGVNSPKPPPSDKQAKAFKAAFSAKVAPISGHLQYTKTHAEAAAHDPLQKRRDELDTEYQTVAAGIDPSDEAKAKGAIDALLAKAAALAGEVAAFRKKAESEYNAWMKAKSSHDTAVKQVEALEAWDPAPAAPQRAEAAAILALTNDRKFAEALKKHAAWVPVLKPVHEAYLKQKAAQPGYEKAKAALLPKCAEAGAAPEPSTPMRDKVTALNEGLKSAGELELKKDYLGGVEKLKEVARLLGEFQALETNADRKKYLAERAPFDADLAAVGTPPAFLADALKAVRASIGPAAASAGNGDYASAITALADAKTKLADLKVKMTEAAAKKAEYEAANAALQGPLGEVKKDQTRPLAARKEAILKEYGEMLKGGGGGDYAGALAHASTMKGLVDTYLADQKVQVEAHKKRIADKLPQIKKDVEAIAGLKCDSVKAITALVARLEAANSSGEGLEQAVREMELLPKLIEQAKVTAEIREQLDKADYTDKDDRAREIIAKYKSDGKIDQLPVEARNALLKELQSGWESDDDVKAVQEMWSTPTLDPLFNAHDRMTREKIVSTLAADPKVQDWRNRWGSMDAAERAEAVKYMTKVPCGKDGWDIGEPTIEPFSQAKDAKGSVLFGAYSAGDDKFTLNTHDDASQYGFDEMMDTITHEIGHKKQAQLVKDFKDGKLSPSDPQYQEAAALADHEWFKGKYPDEFQKVYSTSPKESHSRAMGAEMKGLMGRAFGPDPNQKKVIAGAGTGANVEAPKTGVGDGDPAPGGHGHDHDHGHED